jgi:hypothetical protein
MRRRIRTVLLVLCGSGAGLGAEIEVFPSELNLSGERGRAQIVVTEHGGNQSVDVTRSASYGVEDPEVLSVTPEGVIQPKANGETQILIGDKVVKVKVSAMDVPLPVSFRHETLPVLSRMGCSSGSCHGSPHGKGGFRLSLRAFDPVLDALTLVSEEFGRRTNPIEPDKSLILLKPTTQLSHEGGKQLEKRSPEYDLLRAWIAGGAALGEESEALCTGIEIYPSSARVLKFPASEQQFAVHAKFSDGTSRDVTQLAVFETSSENVATVSRTGLARGVGSGDVAIIVRYLAFIESANLTFVRNIEGFAWNDPPAANYLDEHVYAKLRQLQYEAAPRSSDRTFIRRLYLDLTGLLPEAEAVRKFLADGSPRKRAKLIDVLLESESHATFWAQKWGDLLRVSRKQIGLGPVFKLNRWLVNAVATNQSYDDFARDILTARGSSLVHPAANYYRAAGDTFDAMETSAQLFLGSRIQCAKCHNHPFERWTQNNYYGLAAFFNRVERKKTGRADELIVFASKSGEVTHPATNKTMKPWAPKAGTIEVAEGKDRREAFANWLTRDENPFFAQVEANRIWAHVMGRGIVEPFDDFRDTNPPTNAPLLAALAKDFVTSGYDRRHLLRTILNSNTYQATSKTTPLNEDDNRYFSHYQPRMLSAEQIVDALGSITGRPMQFAGVPASMKATELPAPDLKSHDRGKIGEVEFMKVFGQPERQTICECERGDDSSLGQALELFNGKLMHGMITHKEGRLHKWIKDGVGDDEIVKRLYEAALSRPPIEREFTLHREYLADAESRDQALEDTLWMVLNKSEFLFQH